MRGGKGDDAIFGGDGNDTLYGESGKDWLAGNAGGDFLYGGDGKDVLDGGTEVDYLFGGDGDDILYGGRDRVTDQLQGDDGKDSFVTAHDAVFSDTPMYIEFTNGPTNDRNVDKVESRIADDLILGNILAAEEYGKLK